MNISADELATAADQLTTTGLPAAACTPPGNRQPAENNRAENSPAHDNPAHDNPAHDNPAHDNPAHDNPAHDNPAHDNPTHDSRTEAGDYQRTDDSLAAIRSAIISAAQNAAAQAAERAAADDAAGRCAHTQSTPAYQIPARLREFVNLRDLTCRFPTCRQPAQRCDTDHTRPHDQNGPTCSCNLGPLCRYHHQLKQHPQWHLDQPAPGTFTWTTPTGRTYTTQPDPQTA